MTTKRKIEEFHRNTPTELRDGGKQGLAPHALRLTRHRSFQDLLANLFWFLVTAHPFPATGKPGTASAYEPLLPPKTKCVSRPCDAGI
jgi:hypothetical protein